MHRALSSPTRAALLSLLRAGAGPQSVPTLAEQAELHPNTVRAHLVVLEEAGLVRSAPEERTRPGRPRLVYEADEDEGEAGGGYRLLAQMLAGHLERTSKAPAVEATSLGGAWGRHLTQGPPPSRRVSGTAALTALTTLLDDLGFDPVVDAGTGTSAARLVLRRCPFLQVAEEHQEVVCSIHLGLMRGAMEELGAGVEVIDLIPFAEPAGCVSHLALPG